MKIGSKICGNKQMIQLTMARCQPQGHMLMHLSHYHSSTSGHLSIQMRFVLPCKQQADTQTPA